MTKLNFGRTALPNADGKHTLGRLQCSGRKLAATVPTSCIDLSTNGNQISGIYLIKSSFNQIKTVYCDFSQGTFNVQIVFCINYNIFLIIIRN